MCDYSQLVVTLGTGKTGVVRESLGSGGYNDIVIQRLLLCRERETGYEAMTGISLYPPQ